MRAKRVIVYKDRAGGWRYRVQAHNFRTIEASEESFKRKSTVVNRMTKKYPDAELIVVE